MIASNIDASDTYTWNNGEGFSPIGDTTTKFTGSIDNENTYTISNIFINLSLIHI